MATLKDPLPSDIFRAGQVLNNTYEIRGILGRGGTGEVYLAHHQIVEREMAIKVLNSMFSGNADYLELMKREEEMRMLVHDAVVRYNECSRTDQGHVYLVMDYIEGPSLNDEMMARRLEERELLIIAHRVLEGLVATHARGVVHRDLSPDNIILRKGDPKAATIIDFGIAKDTSAGARTIVGNDFAGKYEYAAPEQLDGHADPRSDLYALGASLLAAHRRMIPDVGRTPGEILRRKQQPLDTRGVPDALAGVIGWLAAPAPADRPPSAEAALDRVSALLKPTSSGTRSSRRTSAKARGKDKGEERAASGGKRRGGLLAAGVGVLAAAGAGVAVWLTLFAEPDLPLAAPYTFEAGIDAAGAVTFAGHAPDIESSAALAAATTMATGTPVNPAALTLADGMPSEAWPERTRELVELLAPLETFDLALTDASVRIDGIAPDSETRATLAEQLDLWSALSGMAMSVSLQAGPRLLPVEQVERALSGVGTCGPLSLPGAPPEGYALSDGVVVSGDLAQAEDQDYIRLALAPLLGDRGLRLDTTTLNPDLCAIRAVLPPVPANTVTIRLSDGDTGDPTLTGVFTTGQNPVVDIVMPASISEGYLWVMVVDNTGKVFHVLPNAYNEDHALAGLGEVEGDVRNVRVLWSIDEFREDQTRLAMQVTDSDFGKSEVIAILSRTPLFDVRRPRDEAVVSVAAALEETLEGREGDVLGVAARIIDARPAAQ